MESDEGWYCDETECISTDECISHTGQISDYTFTLSNKHNYTVSGDELLTPVDIYQDENYYYCKLLLFNNGENYMMGDTLLRHYYSVYDIERYQVGLGKLAPKFQLNYVPPEEEPVDEIVNDDEDVVDGEGDDGLEDINKTPTPLGPDEKIDSEASNKVVKTAAVAISIIVLVMISLCCLNKWRKRKEDDRKLALVDPESTSGISTEEDLDKSEDGDDELLG